MAGNVEEDVLSFVVSQNTSLNIIAPRLIKPSRITKHLLTWEYVIANLQISSVSLIIDDENPIDLPVSSLSYEVDIPEQGPHAVTIRASDPAGNIVSDTVIITIDTTPPAPDFQFPTDGSYLNRTDLSLRWNAIDTFGLDSFKLFIDGLMKASGLKQGSFSIELETGMHLIKIQAFDLAGNMAEKEITVIIDMEAPYFELLTPQEEVITQPYFTFTWLGDDDHGIDHYNFTLDNKPVEELGGATSRQFAMTEGPHKITFRCMDLAGNVRSFTKYFTVDLTEPLVSFKNPPARHIKMFRGLIEWDIIETVGISSIDLVIDGVNYDVAQDSRYFTMDLSKGTHKVRVTVIDIGGFTGQDEFTFTIDPDPPAITKPVDPLAIDGSRAVIQWVLDEPSENLTWKLVMDGRELSGHFDLSMGEYLFTELEPGNHTVLLEVMDLAGNEISLTWDFVIEKEGGVGPDEGSGLGLVWILILILVVIAAGAGGWFFIFRKKPTKEESKPSISPSKKPEKLTFAPRPAASQTKTAVHQHSPSRPSTIAAPASHQTVHTGDHGYIRPEAPKKVEKRKLIIDAPEPKVSVHTSQKGDKKHGKPPHGTGSTAGEKDPGIEEWGELEEWDSEDEIEEWSDMEDY
jgi:hypothetical protein